MLTIEKKMMGFKSRQNQFLIMGIVIHHRCTVLPNSCLAKYVICVFPPLGEGRLSLKKQMQNLQGLWSTSNYMPHDYSVKYSNNCLLSPKTGEGAGGDYRVLLRNPPAGQPWWWPLKTPV